MAEAYIIDAIRTPIGRKKGSLNLKTYIERVATSEIQINDGAERSVTFFEAILLRSAQEASTLIKLLEQAHYNHDNVRSADYAQVVKDYMGDLDGSRLFFLGSDRTRFEAEYGKNLYYNTAFLGNINAAYEIGMRLFR